jgi:hypothetical protein
MSLFYRISNVIRLKYSIMFDVLSILNCARDLNLCYYNRTCIYTDGNTQIVIINI